MTLTNANTADAPETDVAIIGAGPAGMFAIFECGMLGLKCHVVDALGEIGGQCTALYPEKPIYDIPACPEILAADLIARLEEQARPFHPAFHLGQKVVAIRQQGSKWLLRTSNGTEILAGAIIIAGGAGAFGPNRPPLDNIEEYEGKSVFYAVRRKDDFAGKRVVVAGGGDSAVDWAISLAPIASKLYVVHRREKFRAAPESVARLNGLKNNKKIDLVIPYQLKALEGDDRRLTAVRVSGDNGQERVLEADVLLPFFGLSMELGPVADWGLGLENHHISIDPATCSTTVAGIYAIGDIVTYKDKLKLILTGFAEAAQAAHAIRKRLRPGEAAHFEYSTTKGIPGVR